ncbi:hypothetical protein ACQKNX_03410 [Lysinibacillus sp. NPDC093712]|uniref:hypothetical protein n=1 Tax=Lysinibacillus sp. NPDC093712 TaxID=3390579 RepID=UPI003D0507BA
MEEGKFDFSFIADAIEDNNKVLEELAMKDIRLHEVFQGWKVLNHDTESIIVY